MEWIVTFDLPNGGAEAETVSSEGLAAEFDAVVVLLLRDHYCQVSREHARAYSDAFDRFDAENVAVVAALPDDPDRAAYWDKRYDLAFPVLADSAARMADASASGTAMTDGTNRFDAFVDVEAGVESLPAVGVLRTDSTYPRLVHAEGGETIQDCPDPEETLDTVTDLLE